MAEADQLRMQDPVCGMKVEESPDAFWADYRRNTFLFCSIKCRDMFESNPEQYIRQRVQSKSQESRSASLRTRRTLAR